MAEDFDGLRGIAYKGKTLACLYCVDLMLSLSSVSCFPLVEAVDIPLCPP
jgi:hypothetical protein